MSSSQESSLPFAASNAVKSSSPRAAASPPSQRRLRAGFRRLPSALNVFTRTPSVARVVAPVVFDRLRQAFRRRSSGGKISPPRRRFRSSSTTKSQRRDEASFRRFPSALGAFFGAPAVSAPFVSDRFRQSSRRRSSGGQLSPARRRFASFATTKSLFGESTASPGRLSLPDARCMLIFLCRYLFVGDRCSRPL